MCGSSNVGCYDDYFSNLLYFVSLVSVSCCYWNCCFMFLCIRKSDGFDVMCVL